VGGRYKLATHRAMRSVSFFLGLVGPVLQAGLLVIFAQRRLYRRFPFFSAYTLYSIVVSAAQLSLMHRPAAFFLAYWAAQIVYGLLALLAIREVFQSVLEMYYSLYRWTRWVPLLALTGIVALSLWQATYHHPAGPLLMASLGTGAHWFMMGVLGLEAWVFGICLRLGFRRRNPVRWGRYEAGILVGFGVAAVGAMPIYLARFGLGPVMEMAYRYIPPVAYAAAALTWLKAFYREEAPSKRKPIDPELYKRAAEVMTETVEEAEKDLGLRLASASEN
jgi:hypothetical protein